MPRQTRETFASRMDPVVPRVLRHLEAAGYTAYLVGGAVRDLVMGRRPVDYDLTWSGRPEELLSGALGGRAHPTGLAHGTVTWVVDGVALEVTTFRREGGYSDHRHPDKVTFVSDIREDLARRDLTINAMAWSPTEGLVDPFGGREDLLARRIRTVGDPERRFREDALRILRTLRFAARLEGTVDPETAAAVRRGTPDLAHVARERILTEWLELLTEPGAAAMLVAFEGVVRGIFPKAMSMLCPTPQRDDKATPGRKAAREALPAIFAKLPPRADLRWPALCLLPLTDDGSCPTTSALTPSAIMAAFLEDAPVATSFRSTCEGLTASAEHVIRDLRCQAAMTETYWIRALDRLPLPISPQDLYTLLQSVAPWVQGASPRLRDASPRLQGVSTRGQSAFPWLEAFAALFDETGELRAEIPRSRRDLAVRGKDLIAWGVPEGPEVGRALDRLWEAVADGRTVNRREALAHTWRTLAPPGQPPTDEKCEKADR